ncbi:hypothetical protein [Palleronia sp. LCG004]|uniref:hypothetical protein n=1 Tax=Palleronia sp. LCG004 TaxID=3079304 RepID=UPI0029427280|nr:hypothetical protein [Palleronia sp. LCG004]WOI54954.1 hypothetical protein RVY76_07705 [Palleronia sp. LCG004]
MPLSNPLLLSDFMDLVRLSLDGLLVELSERRRVGETGGGEIVDSDLGPRLWRGEFPFADMPLDVGRIACARLDLLRGSGAKFLATDPNAAWPAADPLGAQIATASPVVAEDFADRRILRIAGLPANYRLSIGDRFSFYYGPDNTSLAYQEIVAPVQADAQGETGPVEVRPHLRPGIPDAAPLRFTRPIVKAVLMPGETRKPLHRRTHWAGGSITWQQTLR